MWEESGHLALLAGREAPKRLDLAPAGGGGEAVARKESRPRRAAALGMERVAGTAMRGGGSDAVRKGGHRGSVGQRLGGGGRRAGWK